MTATFAFKGDQIEEKSLNGILSPSSTGWSSLIRERTGLSSQREKGGKSYDATWRKRMGSSQDKDPTPKKKSKKNLEDGEGEEQKEKEKHEGHDDDPNDPNYVDTCDDDDDEEEEDDGSFEEEGTDEDEAATEEEEEEEEEEEADNEDAEGRPRKKMRAGSEMVKSDALTTVCLYNNKFTENVTYHKLGVHVPPLGAQGQQVVRTLRGRYMTYHPFSFATLAKFSCLKDAKRHAFKFERALKACLWNLDYFFLAYNNPNGGTVDMNGRVSMRTNALNTPPFAPHVMTQEHFEPQDTR
jgi:hypothetical protein